MSDQSPQDLGKDRDDNLHDYITNAELRPSLFSLSARDKQASKQTGDIAIGLKLGV